MSEQLFALISPQGVIDRIVPNIDIRTGTKEGWRWLKVEEELSPFDPDTQVRLATELVIEVDRVRRVMAVRDKTTEELAAERAANTESKVNSIDRLVFGVLFEQENRLRVLESGKALTEEEFRASLRVRAAEPDIEPTEVVRVRA